MRLIVGNKDRHLGDRHHASHLLGHHAENAHRIVLALQRSRCVGQRTRETAACATSPGRDGLHRLGRWCHGRRQRIANRRHAPAREPRRIDHFDIRMALEFARQHRATEAPALPELDAEREQRLLFRMRLDALGHEARADVAAEREERHDQGTACAVGVDCVNERAIDLDELGAQLGDDAHARVSRTGVVDGDAVAARAQLCGNPLQRR